TRSLCRPISSSRQAMPRPFSWDDWKSSTASAGMVACAAASAGQWASCSSDIGPVCKEFGTMSFLTPNQDSKPEEPAAEIAPGARLVPRITIQAFCEHSQTAQLVESVVYDRRMSKVALTTHNGGLEAAIETYRSNPTPNLIIIETTLPPDAIPGALERLAEVCDASTRVIVLGHVNDVVLYRDLIRAGISEYLVLPTTAQMVVTAITDLFASDTAA